MNDSRDPMGTDGWLDPSESTNDSSQVDAELERLYGPPQQPLVKLEPAPVPAAPPELDDVAQGKLMAVFGYASMLFGLPVFVIPMLTRDNAFALHHAKAAGLSYLGFFLASVLTLFTCGLTFPLMFVFYATSLVGAVQAANGQLAGPWALGEWAERIFAGIRLKQLP